MIDHFGINVMDFESAATFYDRTLQVLGHRRLEDHSPHAIGWGTETPAFWISTFPGVGPNRESHFAFQAPDRAAVRAWFEEAVAAGAEVLHEPRLFPEYHPNYYGAFVRDADGNNVEACCHGPE